MTCGRHSYSGKFVSITYSEFVLVALVIQYAMRAHVPYFQLCPLRLYSIFPRCLINGTIFEKKKNIERKVCVLIVRANFVRKNSHSKKNLVRYYHKRISVVT